MQARGGSYKLPEYHFEAHIMAQGGRPREEKGWGGGQSWQDSPTPT